MKKLEAAIHPEKKATPRPGNRSTRLPGEEGVWIFVLGDMLVFALFFGTFLFYRQQNPYTFIASQNTLDIVLGAINTGLLLTSSLFVVLAIKSARAQLSKSAKRFFELALLCGFGFVGVKVVEYSDKLAVGISVTTNDFYMYYFMFTGIHLIHVLLGIVVLILLREISLRPTLSSNELAMLESGATYWHMVDLLWIVLFPLLYLLR